LWRDFGAKTALALLKTRKTGETSGKKVHDIDGGE